MSRNRVLALAVVGAFLGLLRWLAPAPAERAAWLYLVALPLGYGHVIGAAVFSRSRAPRSQGRGRSRLLLAAFVGSGLLTLALAYTWALRSTALQPFVLGPILLLFGWHIVENDLALGRSYADGLRLGAGDAQRRAPRDRPRADRHRRPGCLLDPRGRALLARLLRSGAPARATGGSRSTSCRRLACSTTRPRGCSSSRIARGRFAGGRPPRPAVCAAACSRSTWSRCC